MNLNNKEISVSAIKTLFSTIPFGIGTALDEAIFEGRSRIKQNRLNRFNDLLIEYFENNLPNFDLENLKTEEFSDVFESILKKVMETNNLNKLERFKNILIGQMARENTENDFVDTFLDLTSKLSEQQIFILEEFHKKEIITKQSFEITNNLNRKIFDKKEELRQLEIKSAKNAKDNDDSIITLGEEVKKLIAEQSEAEVAARDNYEYIKAEYYKLSNEDFEFYTQDLVSKSLMQETYRNSQTSRINSVKKITEFGIRYLKFIKENN